MTGTVLSASKPAAPCSVRTNTAGGHTPRPGCAAMNFGPTRPDGDARSTSAVRPSTVRTTPTTRSRRCGPWKPGNPWLPNSAWRSVGLQVRIVSTAPGPAWRSARRELVDRDRVGLVVVGQPPPQDAARSTVRPNSSFGSEKMAMSVMGRCSRNALTSSRSALRWTRPERPACRSNAGTCDGSSSWKLPSLAWAHVRSRSTLVAVRCAPASAVATAATTIATSAVSASSVVPAAPQLRAYHGAREPHGC